MIRDMASSVRAIRRLRHTIVTIVEDVATCHIENICWLRAEWFIITCQCSSQSLFAAANMNNRLAINYDDGYACYYAMNNVRSHHAMPFDENILANRRHVAMNTVSRLSAISRERRRNIY